MVLVSWLPSAMIHLLIDPIRYAVGDLKVGTIESQLINHYLSKIYKAIYLECLKKTNQNLCHLGSQHD